MQALKLFLLSAILAGCNAAPLQYERDPDPRRDVVNMLNAQFAGAQPITRPERECLFTNY
jgi:hypothetical protein